MPRKCRVIIPNQAHHIIQRGNYRQYVFENAEDFRVYLYLIRQYSEVYQTKVHSYCLMSNHIHFISTPAEESGLSKMFKNVHMRYSQYKNLEKRRLGHLWQGRFHSCVLSESHLIRAIRYVEMNPVRAKMVRNPWDYVWSSTRQHLRVERNPIVETAFHDLCVQEGLSWRNWKQYLLEDDKDMTREIRIKTQKGLVIGSIEFIMALEKKMGIVLRELKAGRPKITNK